MKSLFDLNFDPTSQQAQDQIQMLQMENQRLRAELDTMKKNHYLLRTYEDYFKKPHFIHNLMKFDKYQTYRKEVADDYTDAVQKMELIYGKFIQCLIDSYHLPDEVWDKLEYFYDEWRRSLGRHFTYGGRDFGCYIKKRLEIYNNIINLDDDIVKMLNDVAELCKKRGLLLEKGQGE